MADYRKKNGSYDSGQENKPAGTAGGVQNGEGARGPASERIYNSIFRLAPSILTVSRFSDGIYVDVNDAFCRCLGLERKDITGKSAYDPGLSISPATREQIENTLLQDGAYRNMELSFRGINGRSVHCLQSAELVDIDGEKYIIAATWDISERKEIEERLKKNEDGYRSLYENAKRSEQVYRSLLNSSADAIVIYDLEGRARYVSPAFTRIFGWSLEEIQGKKIPFLPESEREASMKIIRRLIEEGTSCHGFETRRYAKNGELLDISISASRYDDHEGNPEGILVILRNISERKRLEAKLMHSERMEAIGVLAGGIAHDFNNLMMGMLGYTSLMLHQMDSSHDHYEKLKNIEKLIQSGSGLTSQLLGYARKGKYKVASINLNSVIKQSVQTFARTRKEIIISLDLEKDLYPVEADRGQFEQVFFNLFVNAADASPGGGRMEIATQNVTSRDIPERCFRESLPNPGNYVLIRVKDYGAGMDRETLERIFDPFFTTKELGRGTGLGLASVYGIISSHGGYIDVESRVGKGAEFKLYLPATERKPETAPSMDSNPSPGEGVVLIVDDEEIVLDVGKRLLNMLGYDVIEATDGKTAIAIYKDRHKRIDLVILDVIMPGIGGGEVFDAIKSINPDAKILLSSGYNMDGRVAEIMKRGSSGFIQKPFSLKDLGLNIKKVLEGVDTERK